MAVCDNCGKDDSLWASRPCYLSPTGTHVVQKQAPLLSGEPETLRDRLAVAIYRSNAVAEWLPTVDGSPNAASYEYADRVLVQLALEEANKFGNCEECVEAGADPPARANQVAQGPHGPYETCGNHW